MQKIMVYTDTCEELEKTQDDNLAEIEVSDECFGAYMYHCRIYDEEEIYEWLNQYTADWTLDFYKFVKEHGYKYKITVFETNVDSMEEANTTWYEDDIKGALEFAEIEPTKANIAKVMSAGFARNFHDRMVEFGNELIAARVNEVFDYE